MDGCVGECNGSVTEDFIRKPEDKFDGIGTGVMHDVNELFGNVEIVIAGNAALRANEEWTAFAENSVANLYFASHREINYKKPLARSMRLPNFLVIGAMKAGTTSLHHYLAQHPDVFMLPQKETNFFAQESALCLRDRTVTGKEEYAELFSGATSERVVGETSPAYLCVPDAPRRIAAMIPHAKLIAVLRNPIERAFSHFVMRRRQGKETRTSFDEVIAVDDLDPMRSYKSRGFYGQHLSRYFEHFPREQIKVFLYEDLERDPMTIVQQILRFLDVDPQFVPDMSERHNVNPPAEEKFTENARQQLRELYREDIERTQSLIGKDLSNWLEA